MSDEASTASSISHVKTKPTKTPPYIQIESALVMEVIKTLKDAELKTYLYLKTLDPYGDRKFIIDSSAIAEHTGLTRRTIQRGLRVLSEKGFIKLPSSLANNPEQQVRDRLQKELGGQAEVVTAVGRIDLLTNTEIIEVKHFKDWKAALGQILAYGAFFPNHQKRIHLFGTKDQIAKLTNIEAACISFEVVVTGEVLP